MRSEYRVYAALLSDWEFNGGGKSPLESLPEHLPEPSEDGTPNE
jgi:hypothetical protein